ncbi:translocation/assembly module TamB domain-containing protein [Gracilimonas sp.]|uniref:translocation/assembly module TamB domain-containing protein n=1 Tax=Gracilimonas sp. TaxID=1974203 RepID=UPI0028711ED3|nr:translocation/assembly module TamB domain-containing protein [Gracilimonas sp.]
MSESKKHTNYRSLKTIGWVLLAFILLISALRLSLKWNVVHDFTKNQVESIGNQSLNGTLSIGDIDGDLWKDFKVSNIHIIQEDTILALDSLHIQYNIWGLLGSTFEASAINVSGMKLNIIEKENELFNIQELAQLDTTETEPSPFGVIVETLNVSEASFFVQSPTYLPDSTLSVNQLNATAGFSFTDESSVSLSSLSFKLIEGRLPEPITVQTSASYNNDLISLNQLVIETGRSLLSANGNSNLQDSSFTAEAEALPFSFKDLNPYLDTALPNEELTLNLRAGGTMDSLHVKVQAEGNGFDDLLLISDLSFSEKPMLNKFGISGRNLDIAYFTQDSVQALVRDFSASAEGSLNEDYTNADLTWGFTLNEISYQDYRFEILFGSGTLKKDKLLANFQLSDGRDRIILNPEVDALWSDNPSWKVLANITDINLAWWLDDPGLQSNISFRSQIQGQGFELSEQPWTFTLSPTHTIKSSFSAKDANNPQPSNMQLTHVTDSITIADQSFSDFNLKGSISKDSVSAEGFLQLLKSKINFTASAADFLDEIPTFNYQMDARKFNLNEVAVLEDLSSSINLNIKGSGRHFNPEEMHMETNILIDSSYVNGANFDLLDIDAYLDQNILTIRNGELVSDIISGSFTGRRNIQDRTDPDNNFELNTELKNLQPLASLAGAEILNASGTIEGNVTEIIENELLFDGNIGLNDIRYDSLFTAETIEGTTKISIREELGYDLSLNVQQPTFTNITLQDLEFSSIGTSSSDSLSGIFNFDIISEDAGKIIQSGSYDVSFKELNSAFTWNDIRLQTPGSELILEKPFTVSYRNDAITTDTLSLSAADGTYFTLSIPYADSVSQRAWVRGSDFNFGQIQEIAFGERFINGMLSGNASIHNSPDSLNGTGAIEIADLSYMDTELELLNLNFDIKNERLKSQLSVIMNGEEKVGGFLDVPFAAKAPEELDDSFFAEPVRGELFINPVQLTEFKNLMSAFDVTETNGILSFNGSLSGTAGQPNFNGAFDLKEPVLSGIAIDSASASFNYHHNDEMIAGLSEVYARGQKAASINAEIPVSMDFRTFEMNMPEEDEQFSLNLLTNNFNLSVFNDFLDKQYLNRLQGTLNANVQISGTKDKLSPQGFLRLQDGQLGVPIAGITLSGITSELQLSENSIELNRLNIRSGSGNFTANGSINLDGITPSELNINAKATRFRLANTADYNLTIDLDSQLSGNPMRPKASGTLTVKSGFVYLQDFGEKSVEVVELEGEDTSSFSPYDSLAMDMQFVIERNFQVRNSRYLDLEIDLSGELDAQKQTDSELELFGTLNADRGYARPLGKQFNLEEGRFTFSGPITEPNLYINTSYVPQSSQKQGDPIILYYIIEGNALEPEFRFESEPTMEQQDIICYTLFNKPCYALESWQQVVSGGSGSSPTDLLVGVLLDEVETLATQELGIDVVQIETTRSGTDTGTSIKTGWYLNRKTFFAIVNEISGTTPKTMFILEYLLRENLDLIITQGDDNRQGIDLRWQYDY